MRFVKLCLAAGAAAALWLAACGPGASGDLLPESGEAPGWMKTSNTRSYSADELWQYIDGEAERYIQAGVARALTADYRREELEAKVDVYVMKDAAGARSLFDAEPAAGSRPAEVGDAARLFRQSLVFVKGPHLVRIIAYQETPGAPEALLALAQAVEARLGE